MTAVRTEWQVVVMAKAPIPGRVKTRLCPPFSPIEAAVLAEAALGDTLAAAMACGARRCVLALDGPTGPWAEPGADLVAQRQGDFGTRLAGAVADAWAGLAVPMLVIGMDTPQLDAALLDSVAATLLGDGCDTVLGPAEDGGYWVIGARRPFDGMFDRVPMSTSGTGVAQRVRLEALGLRCELVETLRDVDEFDDAIAVAHAAPATRFAVALASLETAHPLVAGRGRR